MPWYRRKGKIVTPITDQTFVERMDSGHFAKRKHKGFIVVLYYSAVRKGEALKATKEQFIIKEDRIYFDVKKRLKHSLTTSPLSIPLSAPYVDEIAWSVENTEKGKRVWGYSSKTAYNIVDRAFPAYPHFFRLNRITNFFSEGWTIADVKSWTGLSLQALNYYIGLVSTDKMGMSMAKKTGDADKA